MIARRTLILGLLLVLFANIGAGVATATRTGETDACTPGYWKNHHEAWEEYVPSDTLSAMLSSSYKGAPYVFQGELAFLQTATMEQALNFGGGSGIEGGAKILMHHAVASFLNAAHEGLGYPYQRFGPGNMVNRIRAALESGDRDQMLALAAELDDLNNDLECPL